MHLGFLCIWKQEQQGAEIRSAGQDPFYPEENDFGINLKVKEVKDMTEELLC